MSYDLLVRPADTYIDEPGYVDYDPFGGGNVGRTTEPIIRSSTPEPAQQPAEDAMSWLSDLAGQSETGMDDFMSSFGTESTPAAQSSELTPMSAEEAADLLGLESFPASSESASDPLGGMDPLSWLESLAAQQAEGFDDYLGADNAVDREAPTERDIDFSLFTSPVQPSATADQGDTRDLAYEEAGGMSNDISEVQAWLESQARNLEQTRE